MKTAMLRVLLDANLLLSSLLNSDAASPPVRIVEAALAGVFRVLLPAAVVAEVQRRRSTKPYLRQRIALDEMEQFVAELLGIAEIVTVAPLPYRQIVRDPKDAYLIAHAIAARADFLVSGDKDLLVLGQVNGVRIVSPAEFLGILGEAG